MTGLEELIERLEKAEGPSRELDADIYIHVNIPQERVGRIDRLGGCVGWHPIDAPYQSAIEVPAYTSSLDAAVALAERVLDRLDLLEITFQIGGSKQHCTAETEHGEFDGINMPTMPLAIVIATLKARAVQENRA